MPHDSAISASAAMAVSSGRSAPRRQRADAGEQQDGERRGRAARCSRRTRRGQRHGQHRAPRLRRRAQRRGVLPQALHQNDHAKPEQQPAQQPRHVAGAHAQRGADRIVARHPQPERGDGDEQQARQHIGAGEDVATAMACAVAARRSSTRTAPLLTATDRRRAPPRARSARGTPSQRIGLAATAPASGEVATQGAHHFPSLFGITGSSR